MFSQSDIDTLRLMCWCQFVRQEVLNSISKPVEQDNLLCLGLIQYHEKNGAFTLTRKGRSFLQKIMTLPNLTKKGTYGSQGINLSATPGALISSRTPLTVPPAS